MSKPNEYAYVNGQITPLSQARVPLTDRSFLFGDSIYEVTRTYHGAPFQLEQHLARLENSASLLGMSSPAKACDFKEVIQELLELADNRDNYIRIVVSRGDGLGLVPEDDTQLRCVVIVRPFSPYPSEWYEKGLTYITAKTQRNDRQALNPNAKSGNYLNNILAGLEARAAGAHDALMLNARGFVSEGINNNVWLVKDGLLYTPPESDGLLKGITRDLVLSKLHGKEFNCQEKSLKVEDFYTADEAFMTSSTKEIVPITTLDGHSIGTGLPGPITQALASAYKKLLIHP